MSKDKVESSIRITHDEEQSHLPVTQVVNNFNGNFVLTAQMFGNTPETIRKHYYVGESLDCLREILNKR